LAGQSLEGRNVLGDHSKQVSENSQKPNMKRKMPAEFIEARWRHKQEAANRQRKRLQSIKHAKTET
jgi:hypothetical protein